MSNVPAELRYTKEHEWLRVGDDGTAVVGITDHAQEALGDVTFVELPNVGDSFSAGEEFGVVESVKTTSELYMPITGEVLAINEKLDDAPENLNDAPYGDGWLVKIKIADSAELEGLLNAAGYQELI